MVNVWDYARKLSYIKVTTADGKSFTGDTIYVFDAEEMEAEEDGITIETRGENRRIISFFQSQIKSIEVLE